MKRLVVLLLLLLWVASFLGCNHQRHQHSTDHDSIAVPTVPPGEIVPSQLMAAVGIDGVEGFIYYSDLLGEQPQTPEEAARYMNKLRAETFVAKLTGQKFLRYIPLYAADGVTVIGEFGVSYPD